MSPDRVRDAVEGYTCPGCILPKTKPCGTCTSEAPRNEALAQLDAFEAKVRELVEALETASVTGDGKVCFEGCGNRQCVRVTNALADLERVMSE